MTWRLTRTLRNQSRWSECEEIAESEGFEVLHALVVSLYVHKSGAGRDDYEHLARVIESRTKLPLALQALYRYVVFLPSRQYDDVPVPNRFFAVSEDGELKVRGLESRRHDTPPLVGRMQKEALEILAGAHDYDSYCANLEEAREILRKYEEKLKTGAVAIEDLIVSKRLTRLPHDYQKANRTVIAAQQLFGRGVMLRPGPTIEYVVTDAEAHVPNDRVRAYALWEGWHSYNRKKYTAMLREVLEPLTRPLGLSSVRLPTEISMA